MLYPRQEKEGKARGTEPLGQQGRLRATTILNGIYRRKILRPSARQKENMV